MGWAATEGLSASSRYCAGVCREWPLLLGSSGYSPSSATVCSQHTSSLSFWGWGYDHGVGLLLLSSRWLLPEPPPMHLLLIKHTLGLHLSLEGRCHARHKSPVCGVPGVLTVTLVLKGIVSSVQKVACCLQERADAVMAL